MLDKFHADDGLAHIYLYGDFEEEPPLPRPWWAFWRPNPTWDNTSQAEESCPDEDRFRVWGMWDVLHFILVGDTTINNAPESFLKYKSTSGNEALGLPDCYSFTSNEVASIARVLKQRRETGWMTGFDPAAFVAAGIYKGHVQDHIEEIAVPILNDMTDFMNAAARANRGVFVFYD